VPGLPTALESKIELIDRTIESKLVYLSPSGELEFSLMIRETNLYSSQGKNGQFSSSRAAQFIVTCTLSCNPFLLLNNGEAVLIFKNFGTFD